MEKATPGRKTAEPDKQPLTHEELTDIIDLSLWAGQMLLQCGANSQRIEETVHHFGTSLGCNWMDILVTTEAIIVTTTSGPEFRTKTRRVAHLGIDLGRVTAISELSRRVAADALDRFQVRAELERIDQMPLHYNRWLQIVVAGLACGAFSRLFGGDWAAFGITFLASAVAMFVRQELTRHYFNPLLIVVTAAFVAGMMASSAALFHLTSQPESALTAAVLFLVPGVPLLNAALDLIRGHIMAGLARGGYGLLISLAIALGLLIAIRVMGVPIL